MATPEQRLDELGVDLPAPSAPAAAYVQYVRAGNLVFTAGQVALHQGELLAEGVVGRDVDLDTAVACARQCAVNLVAQLKAAVGELSNIERVVKLTVFVASTHDFTQQPLVANGASELLGQLFGEAGRHARSAVGVASLPTNSPVEVEAVVAVRE